MLADAAAHDANNLRFPLTLAKLLIRDNELQKAHELLKTLPAPFKETEQASNLFAHVSFIQAAEDSAVLKTQEKKLSVMIRI